MRTIIRLAASILFATATLPSVAMAQTWDTGRAGAWTSFQGRSNEGTKVCGVNNVGSDGRYFGLKHFENSNSISLHISKPGWSIPRGTQVPVVVQIDQAEPFSGLASGEGNFLFTQFSGQAMKDFLEQFRAGLRFTVSFGGNEPTWEGGLRGSTAITNNMMRCIMNWTTTGAATQPFSQSSPTQPHGTAPNPAPVQTQPFAPAGPGRRT